MKLMGFAVWERKQRPGRNVTFPARNYSVNGDRRSYALFRSDGNDTQVQDRVRDLILQVYDEYRGAGGGRQLTGAAARWAAMVVGAVRFRAGRAGAGAFSFARLIGSVHSARALFSSSPRKNVSFMPPSMMSHGSIASPDRSRKM